MLSNNIRRGSFDRITTRMRGIKSSNAMEPKRLVQAGSVLAAMVLLAVMGNGGHPVCFVQVLAGVMVASALLPFVMKDR
jgi:hypothetical protein